MKWAAIIAALSIGVATWVWADYFPRVPSQAYPSIDELGTIANGGTASCSFATTPICHWTLVSGIGGYTIGVPVSNPATAGDVVTIVFQQQSSGFPAITWSSAWYGFNPQTSGVDLLSNQPTFNQYASYANAATGAAALSFEWDGTRYVLNIGQNQLVDQIYADTVVDSASYLVFGAELDTGTYPNQHALIDWTVGPSIRSGFGGTPSVGGQGSTAGFTVNVGSGGTANSGVIGFTTNRVETDWVCTCTDISRQAVAGSLLVTLQTAASQSSCTIGGFNGSGTATAWGSNDVLKCIAMAE